MRRLGLLLTYIAFLVCMTKGLIEEPPVAFSCTANNNQDTVCNENGREDVIVNAEVSNNSSLVHDQVLLDEFSVTGISHSTTVETTSKKAIDNKVLQGSIIVEDPVEIDSNPRNSTAEETSRNSTKTDDGTTAKSFNSSSIIVSQENDALSVANLSHTESNDAVNVNKSLVRNETTNISGDKETEIVSSPLDHTEIEINQELVTEDRNISIIDQTEISTQEKTDNDSSMNDEKTTGRVINDEYPLSDEVRLGKVLNITSDKKQLQETHEVQEKIILENNSEVLDTSNSNKRLVEDITSEVETASFLQNKQEISVNDPYQQNTAKSIDTDNFDGNSIPDISVNEPDLNQDSFENQPRLNESSKIETILVNDTIRSDTPKPEKIDSSPNGYNSQKTSETSQTNDDLNHDFVRKCCEDHETFSFDTGKCQTASDDPPFMLYVHEMILINSTKNLKILTGRLPVCPGSEDPPFVSEARYDTHSLEAFGHLRDYDYGVSYDHEHYCLELATTISSDVPTLVLAHCIPNIDEAIVDSPELNANSKIEAISANHTIGSNKPNPEKIYPSSEDNNPLETSKISQTVDDLDHDFVRKCCEDHEIFNFDTGECQTAGDDSPFMLYVNEMILVNSTKNLKTLTGRLPVCPGSEDPPIVSEARYDAHSLEAFGYLRDYDYGVEYDHDHYCLELGTSIYSDVPTLVLAHCIPNLEETVVEVFAESTVRKCCEEREYYNVRSQQCEYAGEDPGFLYSVKENLALELSEDLNLLTGLIRQCPGSGEPPIIDGATSNKYALLSSGHFKNLESTVTFNHNHYCLELAAESRDQLPKAEMALAYCMPSNDIENEEYTALSTDTVVRKCCNSDEYFSSITQNCEISSDAKVFNDFISELQIENPNMNLSHKTGKINRCSYTNDIPKVKPVYPRTHTLLSFGHLKDIKSEIKYDHDSYCLEIASNSSNLLKNGYLVAQYCPSDNSEITTVQTIVKKCCNVNQYYNKSSFCVERPEDTINNNSLIYDFLPEYSVNIKTSFITGEIRCKAVPPIKISHEETYIDEQHQLCKSTTGMCLPPSAYCIEQFESESGKELISGAYMCPLDIFYKCCPVDKILTDTGCVDKSENYVFSSHIHQLMEIMIPKTGFQMLGDESCIQNSINATNNDIRWFVKSGFLTLRTERGEITSKHYCIDDYDSHGSQTVMIYMCAKDVDHILPLNMRDHQIKGGGVGKCCPRGKYYYNNECVQDNHGLDLLKEPQFAAANTSDLVYSSFPRCVSEQPYHKYPVGHRTTEDYAIIGKNLGMSIVSLDNGCILSERRVDVTSYCIEYDVNEKSIELVIIVCSDLWSNVEKYPEKYSLTAVLLGISCTALTATAFSLISMRVRRGLVTVKKVNTLAGRILLSYVLSYLLAFLLLAIGMKTSTFAGYSCSILAGFLLFFLLAAFQWNTSICLESLLLTLRVSTSERRRYVCHSLWAWGLPGIITTIALTLDHHKDSLPCSVIIPRIGLYRCFLSDRYAQLLYLYLPMFISLIANMILLTAARYVRSAKLRRLEKGGGRPKKATTNVNATEMQDQNSKTSDQQNPSQGSVSTSTQPQSGLRTHQTRNLWTESMKLVVWSGATWMAEVTSFLLSRFVGLSESWYNYLWYLPMSINSLRGVGIFVILVLTPENRHKIFKVFGNLGSWAGSGSLARHSRSGDGHSTSGYHQSTIMTHGRGTDSRIPGRRNMSIATTVTQISSIRSGNANEQRNETLGKVHPRVAMSVSQIDTRRGSSSSINQTDGRRGSASSAGQGDGRRGSASSIYQVDGRRGSASSASSTESGPDFDPDVGSGGRRKTAMTNFGMVSLPSVDEEDVFDGDVLISPETKIDATQATSDV